MMKEDNYEDIINLPHHTSKKHPRMSLEARSAQFAPFAALTGYDEVLIETARLTNERIEIDETIKVIIDSKLQIIKEHIKEMPLITFMYFVPDLKKDGGKYVTVTGNVKKIDEYRNVFVLENKTEIPINEIIDICGDIVNNEFSELIQDIERMDEIQTEQIIRMVENYYNMLEYNKKCKDIILEMNKYNCDLESFISRIFYDKDIELNRDKEFLIEITKTNSGRRSLHALINYIEENALSILDFSEIILGG